MFIIEKEAIFKVPSVFVQTWKNLILRYKQYQSLIDDDDNN